MIRMREILENNFIINIATEILNTHYIYNFVKKKGFLDKLIYRESEGTRIADYRVDKGKYVIVLYNNFIDHYNRYGREGIEDVLLHEVGHAFLDWYGMSNLVEKSYTYDIDVFDTSQLPFGERNFHEVFSQMVSLIILRDREVKNMYPKWWKLVNDILQENNII